MRKSQVMNVFGQRPQVSVWRGPVVQVDPTWTWMLGGKPVRPAWVHDILTTFSEEGPYSDARQHGVWAAAKFMQLLPRWVEAELVQKGRRKAVLETRFSGHAYGLTWKAGEGKVTKQVRMRWDGWKLNEDELNLDVSKAEPTQEYSATGQLRLSMTEFLAADSADGASDALRRHLRNSLGELDKLQARRS